jgi:hypothetical protein
MLTKAAVPHYLALLLAAIVETVILNNISQRKPSVDSEGFKFEYESEP